MHEWSEKREQASKTVEVKGQDALRSDMDLRNQEETAGRQTCHLTARVVVAMTTVALIVGLFLCLMLFAAPGVDQTPKNSETELREQLQQCQKEHHDVRLMLLSVTEDSRCRLCPHSWLWWRSRCYFFSVGLQENRRWNESAEFCRQHNSSLAVITDSAEMEFIQGVMRKFPQFPFLWVGLTDAGQEGRWLWWDGSDIQHYMPLTVEWDADHRDCADLRGGGSLFAVSCEAFGPWICKKDS